MWLQEVYQVVAGGMALGIAAVTYATAASASKKMAERKRVDDNVGRLISYAKLVQRAAKRQMDGGEAQMEAGL